MGSVRSPTNVHLKKTQSLNTFPNEPNKQIDYVIVYRKLSDEELQNKKNFRAHKMRELFFDKLEKEEFELYEIEHKKFEDKDGSKDYVYCLLHASNGRLLEEAEQISLEMKVRNAKIDDLESISSNQKPSYLNKLKQKAKELHAEFDKDHYKSEIKKGNIVSCSYDPFIKYMYQGVDDLKHFPMGPFSNNTRMVLVDNILNNITFLNDQEVLKQRTDQRIKDIINKNKSGTDNDNVEMEPLVESSSSKEQRSLRGKKGLIYMINEKYFDDAFVLHDESEKEVDFINEIIDLVNEKNNNNDLDRFVIEADARHYLKTKWATKKRLLFFQPIFEIKEYFGENISFYFKWFGEFITTLWLISLAGIALSIYGLKLGIDKSKALSTSDLSKQVEYYTNIFLYSFDNQWMPYFSALLVAWGCFFTEWWNRKQTKLAFEWDVENFNNTETELPEFFQKSQNRKEAWACSKFFYRYEKTIKRFFSYVVLLLMCGAVGMSIAAVVVYRIWVKKQLVDAWAQLVVGDGGSIVMNSLFIGILNQVYRVIAQRTTKWENHRTKSEFVNNLVIKLFIFNFVNNYGNLIYLAYFRSITYSNGYFNLGNDYVDTCTNNYCTPLLTFALMLALFTKSLPNWIFRAFLPWLTYKRTTKKIKKHYEELYATDEKEAGDKVIDSREKLTRKNLNEKVVEIFLKIEQSKAAADDFINEEYLEKTALYGYMIMFGCVLSLAPAIVLIIFLFSLRYVSKGYLMYHKRPIGHKAQNIGSWLWISRFLNVCGIVNLAFYTALHSTWSSDPTSLIGNNPTNRYLYIVIFENSSLLLWLLIVFIFPPLATKIKIKMRMESEYVKKITTIAKQMESNTYHDRFNIRDDQDDLKDSDGESDDESSTSESTTNDEAHIKKRTQRVHPKNSSDDDMV